MKHVQCDVLMYAGKWTPKGRGRLSDQVRHALFRMCRYYGDVYLYAVDLEPLAETGDDPRVAIHIVADWWRDDPDLFGDFVLEALLYHLVPEYEGQLEVDRSEEVASLCCGLESAFGVAAIYYGACVSLDEM